MGTTTRVAKRWVDVNKLDLVEIKGAHYTVADIVPAKKGRMKVTIRDTLSGEKYTDKVEAKSQADVIEMVTRPVKKWTKPDTKAEENLVDLMAARLVGVKPGDDEMWIVPLLDITTIAGHLYLFHGISGIDVRGPGEYENAVSVHDIEHMKPVEFLLEPHEHQAKRPDLGIGPRFK